MINKGQKTQIQKLKKHKKHKKPQKHAKKRNGKRNDFLWCPVPYVWELDLLNSNHV